MIGGFTVVDWEAIREAMGTRKRDTEPCGPPPRPLDGQPCTTCSTEGAYVGAIAVECRNTACPHYSYSWANQNGGIVTRCLHRWSEAESSGWIRKPIWRCERCGAEETRREVER